MLTNLQIANTFLSFVILLEVIDTVIGAQHYFFSCKEGNISSINGAIAGTVDVK